MDSKITIIIVLAIIIFGVGVYAFSFNTEDELSGGTVSNTNNQVDGQVQVPTESLEGDSPVLLADAGSYVDYSESSFDEYSSEDKLVLFFHAGWCPTCRNADKNIRGELDSIPNGLVIFKTDYDGEKDLRRKYGVNYQHTFVQVDSEGNQISQFGGSRDIAGIVRNLR